MTVTLIAEAGVNTGEAGCLEPDTRAGCHGGLVVAGNRPVRPIPAMCTETVADVMVRHPKLCHEDSTVGDVRQLFADDHVHAVLIMSATRLLTVIDRADLGPEATDSVPAARLGRLSGRVIAPTARADTALQQMIAASRRPPP